MRKLLAYFLGVTVTYIVGVTLVSQFNLARIADLGHQINLSHRVQTVLHDWVGMSSAYLPLIAIALALAFLFTGLVVTRFVSSSAALYSLAGFVGVVALHQIMFMVLGMSGIAATRSMPGLLAQGLAGGLGGYVYFRLVQRKDLTGSS